MDGGSFKMNLVLFNFLSHFSLFVIHVTVILYILYFSTPLFSILYLFDLFFSIFICLALCSAHFDNFSLFGKLKLDPREIDKQTWTDYLSSFGILRINLLRTNR